LKYQTSGLTYQAASLDFSSVFREHVAEHKNLWGILKNKRLQAWAFQFPAFHSLKCLSFVPEIHDPI
jgi:hypothetical protein